MAFWRLISDCLWKSKVPHCHILESQVLYLDHFIPKQSVDMLCLLHHQNVSAIEYVRPMVCSMLFGLIVFSEEEDLGE